MEFENVYKANAMRTLCNYLWESSLENANFEESWVSDGHDLNYD